MKTKYLTILGFFIIVISSPAMIIGNFTTNFWIASDNVGGQQIAVGAGTILVWNYQGNWGGLSGTNIGDYEPIAVVHGDNSRVLQTNFNNNSILTITPNGSGHYQYCWGISPPLTNSAVNVTVNATNLTATVSPSVSVTNVVTTTSLNSPPVGDEPYILMCCGMIFATCLFHAIRYFW
jgi:hypothetical protein